MHYSFQFREDIHGLSVISIDKYLYIEVTDSIALRHHNDRYCIERIFNALNHHQNKFACSGCRIVNFFSGWGGGGGGGGGEDKNVNYCEGN